MEGRFRGQHPYLHAEMYSFQPRAIEISGGVADDHESVAVHPRHRKVTPLGNRFRSGADHLPAFQKSADRWMQFVALELVVRIERRVSVIEAHHQADIDDAILHPVDEAAAE